MCANGQKLAASFRIRLRLKWTDSNETTEHVNEPKRPESGPWSQFGMHKRHAGPRRENPVVT
jgi:hypothetical protein